MTINEYKTKFKELQIRTRNARTIEEHEQIIKELDELEEHLVKIDSEIDNKMYVFMHRN